MRTRGRTRLSSWSISLIICATLTCLSSAANPLKHPSTCGRPVCQDGQKFKYQKDSRYKYNYTVDVQTLFGGTSKNASTLYIEANLSIDFLSSCEGILTVSSVSMAEKAPIYNREEDIDIISPELPEAGDFQRDMTQYPLRFAFQDGSITELCVNASETTWVLNFKRGILSAFHNTMKRFDVDHQAVETDVNGDCDTSYSLLAARETSLAIIKTKDIGSCKNRYKHHSILQMTPYDFPANFQVTPVMKSKSSCEITIDHNIYSKVSCEETHLFQPFSNQESGALTVTKQKLTLVSESSSEPPTELVPITRRASLVFDHNMTPKPTSGELKASRELIKTMCRLNSDDVQLEFPDAFTKFIHTARLLSYPALTQIVSRAGTICSSGKKHVYDALPLLGSNAAITVMKDLINKGDIRIELIHEWLMAIAFVPRPDLDTIAIVTPLLYHKNADAQSILGITSLVHTYCRYAPTDCAREEQVMTVLRFVENQFIEGCQSRNDTRAVQEKTQVALKAIGNMGIVSPTLTSNLRKCLNNKNLTMAVRVGAIEATRRLPCEPDRDFFLKYYRDQSNDPELRIAAYLKVMKCPNYLVVTEIRHALQDEEVNQVGSFVWSHLQNLLSTSIPSRIEIQGLLQDKDLVKKFSSDVRKFSHNYEGSMFLDEYNVGGNFESNVIFSPKSYLPRSAMLNLTVDLFGESINVFEVSGRMEGFEKYLEKMFGPQGPFNANTVKEVLSKFRIARSISNDLDEKIDALPNVIDNNFDDPKVGMGFKIFGNELKYTSFVGDKEIRDTLASLNPWNKLRQLLSGQEVNLNKAALFMDTSYIIPTGVGLPITLTALGTAAINLKIAGKLKVVDFPKLLECEGKLRPSVALDVVGTMGVDAYYTSTGIKLKTNLFSSAAVEGILRIEGSKLVRLEFSLPKDRTDIVSARSELIVMKGEKEEPQQGLTENRVEKHICSWPSLDRTLGLNLCVDFQFPNASASLNASHTILNGPTNFGVSLNKADPSAKQFLLEYKWESTETTSFISVMFDTPGSDLNRELSAKLRLDRLNQNLTLHLRSVDSRFLAQGTYKNEPDDKYINFGLELNGKRHLDAQFGIKSRKGKYGFTHYPRLYIAINNERIAELTGSLKWVDKKNIAQCDINLEFHTKKLQTKLFGYVRKTDASVSFDVKLDYKFDDSKPEVVQVQAAFSNRPKNALTTDITGDFKLDSTAYEKFNFIAALKYQRAPEHLDCKLEVNTKPHLQDDKYKLTLQFVFSYFSTQEGNKMNTFLIATKPISEIDLKFELKVHSAGSLHTAVAVVKYASEKEITMKLELLLPSHSLVLFDMKLNVTVPSFTPMFVSFRLQEKGPNEYIVSFSGTWFSGHEINGKGHYEDKSTRKSMHHLLKLLIKSKDFDEISVNCKFFKDIREIRVDLQADYQNDKYALLVKHATPSLSELENYVEVKYKSRVYSLTTSLNMLVARQLFLELHLDQYRDIHLAVKGINKSNRKEASIEVKWDANRDPGQKFATALEFHHPGYLNYSGNFMVSFPGRTVKGSFYFDSKGTVLKSSAHLEWSPQDAIDVKLHTSYKWEDSLQFVINSELLSPFEFWRRTSLTGGFHQEHNMVRANGSVHWQDNQHIALAIFADYLIEDPDFRCELNASVFSNIPQVPHMSGSFFHKHNRHKYITNVRFENATTTRVAFKSEWMLDEGEEYSNLTGIVHLVSPFSGYEKGALISQIHISNDYEIRGVADLELEKKKYTLSLKGHVKEITNSMLEFNITTPIQKYHTITGRFGYSELKKHLIAKLKAPTGAIGIEILFSISSASDFDVKFHVAAPFEILQKLLLVAKLNPNTADFRCGWNNMTLGFTGVWNYESTTHFEYSYIIFTPLGGFEKNGIVAKLILEDSLELANIMDQQTLELEFEVSLKLADKKLGLQVEGASKPQVLSGVHIPKTSDDSDEDVEDFEKEISWKGLIALDTIVYPTFTGTLEIDQKDVLYVVQSTLVLPNVNGTATLYDEFTLEDYFTMNNKLQITTPFQIFKEMNSEYIFEIVDGERYIISLNANVLSKSEWINSGALVNYTFEKSDADDLELYTARVNLVTPFELMPQLDGKFTFEMEENVYRTNLTVETNQTRTTTAANLELDKDFLEASFGLDVNTPHLVIPLYKATARKDWTGPEKKLELLLEKFHPEAIIYGVEGSWQVEADSLFKAKLKLLTPFASLPSLGTSIHYVRLEKEGVYTLDAQLTYAAKQEFKIAGIVKANHISIDLETPLEMFKKIVLNGTLRGPDSKHRTILATIVYGERTFDVVGEVAMTNDVPIAIKLSTPHNGGKEITAVVRVERKREGFGIDAKLNVGKEKLEVDGEISLKGNRNWQFNVKIISSHPEYNLLALNGLYLKTPNGNTTVDLSADTSVKGLERFVFFTNYMVSSQHGKVKSSFDISKAKGDLQAEWVWNLLENMGVKLAGMYVVQKMEPKHLVADLFYRNPKKAFKHIAIGLDTNYNKNAWQFGVNGTVDIPAPSDISVLLNLKMPPPELEVHTIVGKLQYSNGYAHVLQVLKYFTAYAKDKSYGTSAELHKDPNSIRGNLQLEWGGKNLQTISNVLDVKRKEKQIDAVYTLKTPKFTEDTLVAKLFYDGVAGAHEIRANVHCPAKRFISGGDLNFNTISNMKGSVNTTTPFVTIPYLGVNFETISKSLVNKRFAQLFWPNNTAEINSTYTYASKDYSTQLNGSLIVDFPLATRHVGKIIYGYKKAPLQKTGYSFVEYNKKRFLEGNYKCDSISSAGLDKDTINIEIENSFHPLGVLYIHQYEYSGGKDGSNLPTTETKKAEVFKLRNKNKFHLSGEMAIRTSETGQEISMTAKHFNRTVNFKTDYEFLDHQFKSMSVLKLDPNAWASLDMSIVNKTTNEKSEDHVEVNFAYPKRNFTLSGYYQLTMNSLSSEMNFVWDKLTKKKSVGASMDWKQISTVPNKQHAVVSLRHPSFIRDVTLNSNYYSDQKDLFDFHSDLVYSADDGKKLTMSGKVRDHSAKGVKFYDVEVVGNHPSTKLDLKANGRVKLAPFIYETNTEATYKRAFLPLQVGHAKAMLNTLTNEVDMEKVSLRETSYLRGKYLGKYPLFFINGTFARGTEINATGNFFLNLHEQLLLVSLNLTPDASESFNTYGRIPDARNAVFNVWRVYDEVPVSDVAFHLRLNHSRLITSKLVWRPEMDHEIKTGIHQFIDTIVDTFYYTVDYWKQYIRSETVNAVTDVWLDAKPVVQEFLDDIRELKTLETDLEEFKTFLNTSYNANEFYIRDIVNITSYLLDELAIRGHIESFPAILNEVWDAMGDSGAAIRASLLWIIETVKNSYKNAKEFLQTIFRGDSMEHLAKMLERLVEKYDKFIKDLHVQFITHIENLWHKFTDMITVNWNNFLLAVEPTFIKFAHYVETVLWKVSNEILDFLYERQNDIVKSPHYSKFANFTRDISKLYDDIKKNDTLTNIRKYSEIVYEFVKERYFTFVPFGKELQDIVTEILNEFKQLLKLPAIEYVVTKANELYSRVEYLYKYFDVYNYTQQAWMFLQKKLTDSAQTALQAEDRYREAKTKFIFDPENGHVELEQKLPMSWHAFNETPKFEEIPEYKAINSAQNWFVSSNATFWTYYYQYKPYTEPSNWLPPFNAQAIMAGPQHFVTFDKRYFEYHGSCTYLLANDFVDHSFSLAVSYDQNNKKDVYKLALIIDGRTLVVDIAEDTVHFVKSNEQHLPVHFGNTFVYQEAQMLYVENTKGFTMHCNMKYDVCTFTVPGWSYGKTAGLLGTIDNEPSTDFLTSHGEVEKDLSEFARSWALEPQKCTSSKNYAVKLPKYESEIYEKCELLFKSKLSQFSHCFSVVNPAPFMTMCLNSKVANEYETCTAAVAYMQACQVENTPLRIPETCVTCKMVNGDVHPEGHSLELKGGDVPLSTDVVFIVEAKECNMNLKENRSMDVLVASLAKELTDAKFTFNRFAVVVFGGDGVQNKPRSVSVDNKIFTIHQSLPKYFDYITSGNGNSDIFGAIGYAAKLSFRPGVSKTFILLPCSNCDHSNMTLDYTVMHQVLVENDITLHILMNNDFLFDKFREEKVFYGMDGKTAYTKKDVRVLQGDDDLRRQVKLPKSYLGYCTPLALETNGTVFTAKKLETEGKKQKMVKKFATVFGKRVAKTAVPFDCQHCECTADENGMSYMECFPCDFPPPTYIDYGFNDEEFLGEFDNTDLSTSGTGEDDLSSTDI